MILTLDLGTTVTKAALWDESGMVALAGSTIETVHPEPGWSEQDPGTWWASVVDACAQLRSRAGGRFGSVEVVGCTGARQTMVLADADGRTLGPGIVWSDHRAGSEAEHLAAALGGGEAVFDRTGVPLDAGSVAAKIAWLTAHQPGRLEASAWVLTPRDLVAWTLTGRVATDATMASRSGLHELAGPVVKELAGVALSRLAPVVPADQVTGALVPAAAGGLGLAAGTPVVIGAGDRASEVVGTGAGAGCPMVSWGTTANLSVPVGGGASVGGTVVARPVGMVVSRAADGGWLVEGGLSAAGSFLAWLGRITGRPPADLAELARHSPPGARGVTAAPWLDGARAPWWRLGATAGFVGLTSEHGLADLARAVFESVAWEVQRCLEAAGSVGAHRPATGLALGGSGAAVPVWVDVVTGITGLPAAGRRSGQAASAGAALLASAALGLGYGLDAIDPVVRRVDPDPLAVERYAGRRASVDQVTAGLLDLVAPPPPAPPVAGPATATPIAGHPTR